MNPADPLAALQAIDLPPAPGWWPPAPGWWLLALVLLATLGGLIWWWRRRQRRVAPGREAQAALDQIATELTGTQRLTALNQLLRRAARLHHGAEAAALGPDAWAQFLAESAPPALADANWQGLAQAAYVPTSPDRHGEFIALCRAWLRHSLPC